MKSFPCLMCGKELEAVSDSPAQPYGGVMCSTNGNYGSTVFDSDGTIVFIICDECFKDAGKEGKLFLVSETRPKPVYSFEAWQFADE